MLISVSEVHERMRAGQLDRDDRGSRAPAANRARSGSRPAIGVVRSPMPMSTVPCPRRARRPPSIVAGRCEWSSPPYQVSNSDASESGGTG